MIIDVYNETEKLEILKSLPYQNVLCLGSLIRFKYSLSKLASQLAKESKYALGGFHMTGIVLCTFIYVIQFTLHYNAGMVFQDEKWNFWEVK